MYILKVSNLDGWYNTKLVERKHMLPISYAYKIDEDEKNFYISLRIDCESDCEITENIIKHTVETVFSGKFIGKEAHAQKKTFYTAPHREAVISLDDLIFAMIQHYYHLGGCKYINLGMKYFAKQTGVALINGVPGVIKAYDGNADHPCLDESNDVKLIAISERVMTEEDISEIYIIRYFIYMTDEKADDGKGYMVKNIRSETIYDYIINLHRCPLAGEFIRGSRELSFEEIKGLGSYFVNILGGKSLFKSIIQSDENSKYHSYKRMDWKLNMIYQTKLGIMPIPCDNFCWYKDFCNRCEQFCIEPWNCEAV